MNGKRHTIASSFQCFGRKRFIAGNNVALQAVKGGMRLKFVIKQKLSVPCRRNKVE